jgi:hypothetical protein
MAVTAAIAVYALAVAWTGGLDVRIAGVRLRSHSWIRPAIVAAAGAALLIRLAGSQLATFLARGWSAAESQSVARACVFAAMVWTLAAGVLFGTFANGGADSYGYVGQARLLAHGRLTDTIPLSHAFKWPDVEATLTPLGFTRGRSPGVIAPKYPPGFPLLLAPLTAISESAIYMLVPMFGLLAIWATYRLGVELGDPLAGGIAAVLLSASPTFLYQVVQPMSDVPATACWLCALLVASRSSVTAAAAAGAISSVAILIRPNLAPLAGLIFIPAVAGGPGSRAKRALAFVAAITPGLVAMGWIQNARYGSPLASGYGTIGDAFATANIRPNLVRYPRWLTESHTWFIWLSVLAPFWIVRRAARPLLAWVAVLLALAIWTAYLPYVPFRSNEWFYTRFLLPAIALMLFFATAASLWGLRRLPAALRLPVTSVLLLALVVTLAQSAKARGAFEIRFQERKYPLAGIFVRDRLPPSAFVLAAQHSGSIRYYARRPTLRWDLLGAGHLDEVLAALRGQGFEPFLVVDDGETEEFRRRFDAQSRRVVSRLSLLAVLGDARVYAFD